MPDLSFDASDSTDGHLVDRTEAAEFLFGLPKQEFRSLSSPPHRLPVDSPSVLHGFGGFGVGVVGIDGLNFLRVVSSIRG